MPTKSKSKASKTTLTSRSVEHQLPEEFAEIFEQITDPLARVEKLLEMADMPKRTAKTIMRRIQTRYNNVNRAVKEIKTRDIVSALESKIELAFDYMDDTAFARASLRDLSITLGILIEKRQLLRGEPTQILSTEERQTLDISIPLIVKEAQRRGMIIEMTPIDASSEEGVSARLLPHKNQTERTLNKTAETMTRRRKEINIE